AGEAYFDLRGVQLSGRAHLSVDVARVAAFGERLFERIFGAPPESSRAVVARQAAKRTLVTVEALRLVSVGPLAPVRDGPERGAPAMRRTVEWVGPLPSAPAGPPASERNLPARSRPPPSGPARRLATPPPGRGSRGRTA